MPTRDAPARSAARTAPKKYAAEADEQRAEHAEQHGGLESVCSTPHIRLNVASAAAFPRSPCRHRHSSRQCVRRVPRPRPLRRSCGWPSSPAWTPASTSSARSASSIGDAHLLRNAGGMVTDDVLRSLAISQRALGTREIAIIHHTECGMDGFDDVGFRARARPSETGAVADLGRARLHRPARPGAAQSSSAVRDCPWLPHRDDGHAASSSTSQTDELQATATT